MVILAGHWYTAYTPPFTVRLGEVTIFTAPDSWGINNVTGLRWKSIYSKLSQVTHVCDKHHLHHTCIDPRFGWTICMVFGNLHPNWIIIKNMLPFPKNSGEYSWPKKPFKLLRFLIFDDEVFKCYSRCSFWFWTQGWCTRKNHAQWKIMSLRSKAVSELLTSHLKIFQGSPSS